MKQLQSSIAKQKKLLQTEVETFNDLNTLYQKISNVILVVPLFLTIVNLRPTFLIIALAGIHRRRSSPPTPAQSPQLRSRFGKMHGAVLVRFEHGS